ncbi:MAG: efflux RND transporter permease subunit [Myxococcota bacterium]
MAEGIEHEEPKGETSTATGAIAWMARNPVAANLLMLIIMVGGVVGLLRVKQEVFPSFDLDVVGVSVPYPGASPSEVEQGIVLALEEELRGLDGVKRVTATAVEGYGALSAELLLGENPDKLLADVKSAVDRVTTLPEEAEEPTITLVSQRQQVISMVLSGDQELRTLHDIAEDVRERLLTNPNVTQVDLQGVRPLEIAIEVPQETLEAYGLSLEQIAAQVRGASLELPGGALKTRGGELLVRVADRRLEGTQFAEIVIKGTTQGGDVRLGDIATITDGYADTDLFNYYNGEPAVRIVAYRIGNETPQQVADIVKELKGELQSELPENLTLSIWDDDSQLLRDRIDLLSRNAWMGMILVLLVLTAFLDLRLAIWVGLGIPISILGAFAIMPAADVSVNMISLFAFIITLGMVVDDAIVVGENVYEAEKQGESRINAAVKGASQMVVPVSFSILTTVIMFTPLLFVPGFMGKIFGIMPTLVIMVLLFSWIESFFVLPAHLGHGGDTLGRIFPPARWFGQLIARLRAPFENGLVNFRDNWYAPTVDRLIAYRYISFSVGLGLFVLTMGVLLAGIVPRTFFPKLEGELVTASARLPYGTPVERTREVQRAIEAAAQRAVDEAGEGVFKGMYASLGAGPASRNGAREEGAHLVSVEVQLVPTGERDLSSQEFSNLWSAQMPKLAGIESLIFSSSVGPGAGAAVDVLVSHPDTEVLERASNEVLGVLKTYDGLTDHENSFALGKPQLDFKLLPAAATLGLTGNDVARQIRSSFFGAEALREQRGRNELKVMVRLPGDQRDSEYHLERLRIRTPTGGFVPLSSVAEMERGRAPTTISREDGRRVVNVTAELAPTAKSSADIVESLGEELFPSLRERYPGILVDFAGEQREQAEVGASLGLNFVIALFLMYAMLAIPFKSYVQPVLVMLAIPMGVVGAVFGHFVMGYEMSMISAFGVVALAGVVVNDSLVMIDAINKFRDGGMPAWEAAKQGGVRRLRPILLTSLTTFFGLAPMILETSVQARFLIPMAISLGFGVLFATAAILLLGPPVYMIIEDLVGAAGRGVERLANRAEESAAAK